MVSYSSVDFLPICDLLFNFISVASYFCDIAFHIIVAYTFYRDFGLDYWFLVVVCATIVSLFACQTLSMKWYIEDEEQEDRSNAAKTFVYCIHLFQCGVLWRYSKLLFLPMGSSIPLVKREMRNLCILRMIHGFCQGLPLLFVQGFLMATKNPYMDQVHTVSVALSFFGICWSLASFNKNVRSKDVDKLVLTWIGVIFQLLWRLGTVSSRVLALVVYASAWPGWIILVLALHWLCMFLWFLVQHQDSEVLGKTKHARLLWSFILSYIHNIAYINVEKNSDTRLKIAVYYAVTFIENILLVSLWTTSSPPAKLLDFNAEQRRDVVMTVVLAFVVGLFFMLLYYRLFHTSKISSAFQRSDVTETNSASANCQNRNGKSHNNSEKVDMTEYSNNQAVFNCVLNPAMRKKKKIPSVLPPPPLDGSTSTTSVSGQVSNGQATSGYLTSGKSATPFWKEPLPVLSSVVLPSPTETNSIRQKLQTKRDNQLKQLQLIENEIRAGHIKRPVPGSIPAHHAMPLPPVGRLAGHGQHVHRDPGVHPYLNIHDPLNDSSGDQGDVDSGDEGFPVYNQIYRRRESKPNQQRRYETPM